MTTRHRSSLVACLICVAVVVAIAPSAASADLLFDVNRTNDLPDSAVGDHACDSRPTLAGDQCTLRAAIQESNLESGLDEIHFNIPGNGVKTIAPSTALPAITGPVAINGYTQGLSSPNTKPLGQGDDAILLVELNGENAPFPTTGLTVDPGATGSRIKGLVINRFAGTGLVLHADATVQGNFIGTGPGGMGDLGSSSEGIFVEDGDAQIGGLTPATRNVISGNGGDGISGTGNFIVQGNYIGTQRDGTSPLGNTESGIAIFRPANTIGGVGGGNVIAFNGATGISVGNQNAGNPILRNRIFSNVGLGIDLGDDGKTPNDVGDSDLGPNQLQNFPTILSATRAPGGAVTVGGRLQSTPNQQFTLEFFKNPPGGDEGALFIGQMAVMTNGAGFANFTFHPARSIPVGDRVTSTATNAADSTSEFSPPRKVVVAG